MKPRTGLPVRAPLLAALLISLAGCQSAQDQPDAQPETAPAPAAETAPGTQAAQARSAPAATQGWQTRVDEGHGSGSNLSFTAMSPGWHITTGPTAILYHPSNTASGQYRVESEIHLFEPGERLEGFGLFVGGQNLDAAEQSYLYFLIRQDGRYLVKRRHGAGTTVVQDWTEHPAIVSWAERPTTEGDHQTAVNTLAIDVGATDVAFLVNDQEVLRRPKQGLETDGLFGLRVAHALNLHVTSLELQPSGG